MNDPYADFQKSTLQNGLDIYCLERERMFETVWFLVHAGCREDAKGKEGLAHMVEHMTGRSIPSHPDYAENRRFFKEAGGTANFGWTNFLVTGFHFKLPLSEFRDGYSLFAEMLMQGQLGKNIDRERNVLIRDYVKAFPTHVSSKIALFPERAFFPEHRLAHSPPIGEPQSMLAITAEEIRRFYSAYYVPANISIVCAGGMPLEVFKQITASSPFGRTEGGASNRRPAESMHPRDPVPETMVVRFRDYMKSSPHKSMVKKVFALPTHTACEVVEMIGSEFYDCMMRETREAMPLATEIKVEPRHLEGMKLVVVDVEAKPDAFEAVSEKIALCARKMFATQGDLDRRKSLSIRKIGMRDPTLERVAESAAWDIICWQKIKPNQEEVREINDITLEQVRTAIEGMLSPKHCATLMVVP